MTTENMEASTLPAAIITELKTLDIQPGNVVVLRLEAQPTQEAVTQLVRDVRQIIPDTSTVAVLVGDADMSVLTDESMRGQGWVRQSVVDELVAAIEPVIAISDRKHDAWDRAKELIASIKGDA